MADTPSSRTTLADLCTSIALLQQAVESLRGDVAKIEVTLTNTLAEQARDIRELQKDNLIRCAAQDTMRTQVDDHEIRLDALERLAPAIKVVIWIGGVLGISVIGLIWALITGSSQILFR